jgi:hypothetical protein
LKKKKKENNSTWMGLRRGFRPSMHACTGGLGACSPHARSSLLRHLRVGPGCHPRPPVKSRRATTELRFCCRCPGSPLLMTPPRIGFKKRTRDPSLSLPYAFSSFRCHRERIALLHREGKIPLPQRWNSLLHRRPRLVRCSWPPLGLGERPPSCRVRD